ncbi:MAG TPA: MFS transporter [Gaiellales bacterium]|nr:MFS transporter [Gaiellales bacterium]
MSRRRTILALAIISQAAIATISFGLPAIALDVRSALHVGPAGFGAVYAAPGLGSAAMLIPAGMLVDRLGGRRVLLAGGAINCIGDVAAGLSHSPWAFAAGLLVAGAGGAAVPVAGMTSLLREFSPAERGMAMGWRQLAVPLGGTIGSVALPALVSLGGVRLALISAGVAAGLAAAAFSLVPEASPTATTGGRGLDGALSVPGMRALIVCGVLYAWALGGILTYYTSAARHEGLTAGLAAAGFTVLNLTAAAARPIWGRLADRGHGTHRAQTLRNTGIVAAVAAASMPLALAAGAAPALLATALVSFGIFGFNGVLYLLAGELAGEARAGRAVGIASTVVFGFSSVASPVAGLAIESNGYGAVWVIAAVTAAAGAVAAMRLPHASAGYSGTGQAVQPTITTTAPPGRTQRPGA